MKVTEDCVRATFDAGPTAESDEYFDGDNKRIKKLAESMRAAFLRNGFHDWEQIAKEVMEDMK